MTTEFYKDTEIFMTGGSGVVGKAAIEKLFRSCEVKKIYVLIRPKKNITPEDRLNGIKNSRIFNVLKECKPKELDKLVAIPGDTTLDGFGISEEHLSMMKNVSVYINSAATTRFDMPLRTAINLNLKSTLEALRLAESFKGLKIFLHVSTFYSNPFASHIEDKVYPAMFDWKTALRMLDSKYDQMEPVFEAIVNKVIDDFPNTYVFTKHLAEQLVNDHRHKLPVAIYRPSIIVTAFEEPEIGFTETLTGVMGLLTIWGTGLMQVLLCKPKKILDVTPLDATTKFMLAFTAKSAKTDREKIKEATPVGMFSSSGILTHTLGEFGNMISKLVLLHPFEKSLWIPHMTQTSCTFIFVVYTFFLQLLPSILIDAGMRLMGKKPMMMGLQRKIYITSQALKFFISSEFSSTGPTDFQELLSTEKGTAFDVSRFHECCAGDKKLFELLEIVMRGCRKFLLNEDESTLPQCRKILKVKIMLYNIFKVLVLGYVGYLILRKLMS